LGDSKVRGLMGLCVAAIVAVLSLQPAMTSGPTSASSPSTGPLASVVTPTSTSLSSDAPGSTKAPALTATPTLVPTPTPEPNHYIWVPWRSQFDGTAYASANCGPAALGMAMSYYGEWWSTNGIRQSINAYSGVWGLDAGTDWPSLKYAAERRDFTVLGLYDPAGNYREWTIDDLVKETEQKHPVLLLVHYRDLPGHTDSDYYGDHYIVFLGLMADGRVVYHDPAYYTEIEGSYRIMSQKALLKAWSNTSVDQKYTAMSVVWEHDARKWDDSAARATPQADRQ